jgi:hypothetical protein
MDQLALKLSHAIKINKLIPKFHPWFDWTLSCITVTDKEVDELYNAVNIGT